MRWFNSVTYQNFSDEATAVATTVNEAMTVTTQRTVAASAGLHDSEVVCVTYFTQPSTSLDTNASNIPSYTHTWTSPTLDVKIM